MNKLLLALLLIPGIAGASINRVENNLVTTGKIANGSVTTSKLSLEALNGFAGLMSLVNTLTHYIGGALTVEGGLWVKGGQEGEGLRLGEVAVANGFIESPLSIDIFIDSDASTSNATFRIRKDSNGFGGGTNLMTVQENGNVGIGTASPGFTLDVDGQIGGSGVAGEYTAVASTTTNLDNTASATSGSWRWMRLGNQVQVVGQVNFDATTGSDTDTLGEISLPIASTFTSVIDASGVCTPGGVTSRSPRVHANTTNNTVSISWRADVATSKTYYCTFMYEVK